MSMQIPNCFSLLYLSLIVSSIKLTSSSDLTRSPFTIDIEYDNMIIRTKSLNIPEITSEVVSLIDINSYSTWLDRNCVESVTNLINLTPAAGKYGLSTIYGYIARMTVNFHQEQCPIFPLIIVNTIIGVTPAHAKSIIGLGIESYFMSYLQSNNLRALFTMSFHQSTKGTILIGDIPPIVKQAPSMVSYCKSQGGLQRTEWGCQLSYVIIGAIPSEFEGYNYNNTITISTKHYNVYKESKTTSMIFESIEHLILCPDDFVDFLHNHYFNEAIKSNGCSYSLINNHNYFICIKESINALEPITIVIDDHGYTLSKNDLFFTMDSCLVFLIRSNDNEADSQEWRIGNLFLRKYTTVFNSEERTIGFFSQENKFKIAITDEDIQLEKIKQNENKPLSELILLLLKMAIALNLFSIVLIMIIKFNEPKGKYYKDITNNDGLRNQ